MGSVLEIIFGISGIFVMGYVNSWDGWFVCEDGC